MGKVVNVKVIREGKEVDLKVKMAEITEQQAVSKLGASSQTFGLTVDNIKPQWKKQFTITTQSGVVVIDVAPGSPADDVGIQPGDVIREVNKKTVNDLNDYRKAIALVRENKTVIFLMNRADQSFYVSMKVSLIS